MWKAKRYKIYERMCMQSENVKAFRAIYANSGSSV